jgi:uncharacterized membrane protein YhhN
LTLFSQLVFVQARCAQFPAVALALIVVMMVISGVYLNAIWPKLEILRKRWWGEGKESRNG